MDPLSFTASLLAVIGAANSTAKGVEKLLSLRHARSEVAQLLNEIEELQLVLLSLNDADKEVPGDGSAEFQAGFQALIDRAGALLSKLDETVHLKLVSRVCGIDRPRISHFTWLQKRSELMRLKENLRAVTGSISRVLAARHLKQTRRIMIAVDRITTSSVREAPQTSDRLLGSDNVPEHKVEELITAAKPTAQPLVATSHDKLATSRVAGPREGYPGHDRTVSIETHRILERDTCHFTCRCQCHAKTTIQSPAWLSAVFGQMFCSYVGTPLLAKRACNLATCKQHEAAQIKTTYRFPAWLAPMAMICYSVRNDLCGLGGSWSLHVPRFMAQEDNKALFYIQKNDVLQLQRALDMGVATVMDVSDGVDLLETAISCGNDCIELLLQKGARWDMEDELGVPTSYKAWERSIIFKQDPVKSQYEDSLRRHSLFTDVQFSGLHLIVTGLSNVGLEGYLNLNPNELYETDLAGRTPMMWAAWLGEVDAFLTLLKYSNDPAILRGSDRYGYSLLHFAVYSGNEEIVETVLRMKPDVEAVNNDKTWTALRFATSYSTSDVAALLIKYGANVNASSPASWTALHYAVAQDLADTATLLLDNGADIEATTHNGATPLLIAIENSSYACVEILLERAADLSKHDDRGRSAVQLAAVSASVHVMGALANALNFLPECSIPCSHDTRCCCLWCLFTHQRPTCCSPRDRSPPQEEMAAFAPLVAKKFNDRYPFLKEYHTSHSNLSLTDVSADKCFLIDASEALPSYEDAIT